MRWTVRLEARTDQGEVEATELVTFSRPVVDGTLADLGLALSEAKAVLAELQASMVRRQVAEYVACHRLCRREWQKPGALCRELDRLLAEASVQHRGPDLKHAVGAPR